MGDIQLLGEFECKVDAKGRMRMPTSLIKQLESGSNESFVVNRGYEKYLMLYPKQVWDELSQKVNQLPDFNQENLKFIRYFYRGAQPLEMDSSDRILIPRKLLDYAGIEKDLVVFARNNKMELWDSEMYEAHLNGEPTESFMDLAEKVLGQNTGPSSNM